MEIRKFFSHPNNYHVIVSAMVEEEGYIKCMSVRELVENYTTEFLMTMYLMSNEEAECIASVVRRDFSNDYWILFGNEDRSGNYHYRLRQNASVMANSFNIPLLEKGGMWSSQIACKRIDEYCHDIDDWHIDLFCETATEYLSGNTRPDVISDYWDFIRERGSVRSERPSLEKFKVHRTLIKRFNLNIKDFYELEYELNNKPIVELIKFLEEHSSLKATTLKYVFRDAYICEGVKRIDRRLVNMYHRLSKFIDTYSDPEDKDKYFTKRSLGILINICCRDQRLLDDILVKYNKLSKLMDVFKKLYKKSDNEYCEELKYSIIEYLEEAKLIASRAEFLRYHVGTLENNAAWDMLSIIDSFAGSVMYYKYLSLCLGNKEGVSKTLDKLLSYNVDFDLFKNEPIRALTLADTLKSVNSRLFRIKYLNNELLNAMMSFDRLIATYIIKVLRFNPAEAKQAIEADSTDIIMLENIAISCLRKAGIVNLDKKIDIVKYIVQSSEYSMEESIVSKIVEFLSTDNCLTWEGHLREYSITSYFIDMMADELVSKTLSYQKYMEYRENRDNEEIIKLFKESHPDIPVTSKNDIRLYNKYGYIYQTHKFNENMQDVFENCGVDVMINGKRYTAKVLSATDQLAYEVGNMTSCCQHFGGFGETAMVYSLTMPNSGVWTLFRDEVLIAQAEVWFDTTNTIFVFDNIEMSNNRQLEDANKDVLRMFCDNLVKRGYKYCIGLGYNDQKNSKSFNSDFMTGYLPMNRQPECPVTDNVYTDIKEGVFWFRSHVKINEEFNTWQ